MPRKKAKEVEQEPRAPKVKRVFKPERCPSHKFIVEADGRVDMLASHVVTDDSICFNCGLYFSTWTWYSNKINASYWDGVDSEMGQSVNYIAQELDRQTDRLVNTWGTSLLEKLRERRKKNGKQRFSIHNGSDSGDLRKAGDGKAFDEAGQ